MTFKRRSKLIDPPLPNQEDWLTTSQGRLLVLYHKQQRFSEAESLMLSALGSRIKNGDDTRVAGVLANLCQIYTDTNRSAGALEYGLRAIAAFDNGKLESPALGYALVNVARAELKIAKPADAESHFVRARDVFDRVLPDADQNRLSIRNELGTFPGSTKSDTVRRRPLINRD